MVCMFYICGMKSVKIIHHTYGDLVNQNFHDDTQFKLVLKLVHSCIELGEDLTTFNGKDFLLHVPHSLLVECIVIGKSEKPLLSEYMIEKTNNVTSK